MVLFFALLTISLNKNIILSQMIMLLKMIIIEVSMDQKILDGLLNPVRMRIFQYVLMNKQATTAEIGNELPGVPQASLYRHMNKLVKDGILGVLEENKVRGVYEKVYEIKNNPMTEINKIVDGKDREQLYNVCYTFAMSILMDFGSYLKKDDIDLKEDKVGFRSIPVYMTDEESDVFIKKMYDLIESSSSQEAGENRKLRKYSFAFMPVEERK